MGEIGYGVGAPLGDGIPEESVTGVGGPVLLAASTPDLERGDVLAARYQIEAAIGTGGSGRVLRAFDRMARAAVALKILRPEYVSDPVWTERFSRELRVGRQIQHPNVCRVFDIGYAEGQRFLSMELATRGTVRGQIGPAALERSLEERIVDARAVVEGAAALHAAGIIHRDLKPENILRMEDGRLVVSDFGLATDPGSGPTTTIMVGTPRYMAPEVVMGDPATARADVWALGIVMHEILFGVRPDRSVIRRGTRQYTPPQVSSARERRLAELCGHCAEEEPRSRPASAEEVRREFESAVQGRRFRRGTGVDRRQTTWAAVAIAGLAVLGIARDRWTSRAVASSTQLAAPLTDHVLRPTGKPLDWSKNARTVASLAGRVHCFSLDGAGRSATVVWGEPRRAEQFDLTSGARSVSALAPFMYESGCPQMSPDGRQVLYEKTIEGSQEILLAGGTMAVGKEVVRGNTPSWLPNGQEFSFALDPRHAAIFSIPTREMTIIADGIQGQFGMGETAIDSAGARIAVLYTTESLGSTLIVHRLPSLEVVTRLAIPQWARNLKFDPGGNVLFTALGTEGFREVVSADLVTGSLRHLAAVPGLDIRDLLDLGNDRLVVTRQIRFDLWRSDGLSTSPLTHDGRSVNGSLSGTGKLLIQRMLPGSEVIVLRDERGGETQMTDGPFDVAPAFLPDGDSWVYSRVGSAEIMQCALSNKHCAPLHRDPLMPAYPTPDPSGLYVAYLTTVSSTNRVRVFDVHTREQRDLGPALFCAPVWTSPDHLWVMSSSPMGRRVWVQLDVRSGERTGQVHASVASRDSQDECRIPPLLQRGARVFGIERETSRIVHTVL